MFVLLFVMFVSCQGFLLDSNTQTTTTGGTSLDNKRYNTIMGLLTEERRSRSKLEAIVAQELLALRQEVAKCQCGNGNGGHNQINNQGSPTNDTKVLKEEIIHLKREQELLKTEAAELVQNNTALKDKVVLLERNLTTMQNKQRDLNLRNETSHLEKALQITDNKLNTVMNNANARTQDFIALFQKVIGLEQNHTVLKDNVILLERNISTMANSRNQSFISLSEIVAGLIQNSTVLKDNAMQLEQNFTMEKTKLYLNFRNETSQLEKALQITNNKLNAVTNDANARKQDFIALFQKVQSTEQRLENSRKSLEASQNMTFLRLQKEIINGAKLVEQNLSDRTKLLEMRENSTSLKLQQQTVLLQQELNKISSRVALTTCAASSGVTNDVIKFTGVEIANGIHNTDSIRNSGIFTCENPGLYLISVFITTNTKHSIYYLYKNSNVIAYGVSSQTDYVQTTSVTVIAQLTVNDTISATGSLYIGSGYESCLTILQIQ